MDVQVFTPVGGEAASNGEVEDKKATKWLDLAAALVPAEVLAISLAAVQLQTKTDETTGAVAFTASTRAMTYQFVILMVLPAALFVAGRTTPRAKHDVWRAAIPCLAFVAWSLLQTGGLWAAVEIQFEWLELEEGTELVIAAALVLLLGGVTARLATLADKLQPVDPPVDPPIS